MRQSSTLVTVVTTLLLTSVHVSMSQYGGMVRLVSVMCHLSHYWGMVRLVSVMCYVLCVICFRLVNVMC